jgi:hypothetical protein
VRWAGVNYVFVHMLLYNKHLLINMNGVNIKNTKHLI